MTDFISLTTFILNYIIHNDLKRKRSSKNTQTEVMQTSDDDRKLFFVSLCWSDFIFKYVMVLWVIYFFHCLFSQSHLAAKPSTGFILMSNTLWSSFSLYSASNVCGTGPYTANTQYQICQAMILLQHQADSVIKKMLHSSVSTDYFLENNGISLGV